MTRLGIAFSACVVLLAGCGKPAVDDTAHLQALLKPYALTSSSTIATLTDGSTRASSTVSGGASTLMVRQSGKQIEDVELSTEAGSLDGLESIDAIAELVGRSAFEEWRSAEKAADVATTRIGDWNIQANRVSPSRAIVHLHVSRKP